ncbi:hypothetical protein OAU00_02795 [Saprospiraceae bacterium]|nr:hypothetical protein [Saprospiraceae bacterium]
MGSSKFSSPFFQKSPLYGAYTSAVDGIVPVSYDDIHKDFQKGIADNVSKAYAKKKNPCDDPNTVQYTEDSVLKKCPKKTAPITTTTTDWNSKFKMPADFKALLPDNGTESKPTTGASSPGIYDVLAKIAKPIQDQAVTDIKAILDPKRNNLIQEED